MELRPVPLYPSLLVGPLGIGRKISTSNQCLPFLELLPEQGSLHSGKPPLRSNRTVACTPFVRFGSSRDNTFCPSLCLSQSSSPPQTFLTINRPQFVTPRDEKGIT